MKPNKLKLALLVLQYIGIAALFLPFTRHTSPWQVVVAALQELIHSGGRFVWVFVREYLPNAATAFLAVPVVLLSLRLLFARPLTKLESWIAYLLGLGGSLTLVIQLVIAVVPNTSPSDSESWTLVILTFSLAAICIIFTLTTLVKGLGREYTAPVALRCGYFPNAIFCLAGFSDWFRRTSELQIGAGMAAVTVALYFIEVVYFTRQGWRSRRIQPMDRTRTRHRVDYLETQEQ